MKIHTSNGVVSITTATHSLEGNERERQAGVTVEEERKGEVHTLDNTNIGCRGSVVEVGETAVRDLLRASLAELRPDTVPVSVVLINLLPTTSRYSWILITGLDYTLNSNIQFKSTTS
jgi:hypothetical protein